MPFIDNSPKSIYTTKFMLLGETLRLLKSLKRKHSGSHRIKISSANSEFIRYLKKSFEEYSKDQISTPIISNKLEPFLIKKQIQEEGLTLQKIIVFNSTLLIKTFIIQYKCKLEELNKEYNVKILWNQKNLQIYCKNLISPVFLAEILLLKRNFTVKWFRGHEISMKSRYSIIMRKVLKEKNIYVYPKLLHGGLTMIHGDINSSQLITEFVHKFSYECVYIIFRDTNLPLKINRCLFELIIPNISYLVTKIRTHYEIPFEINHRSMTFIIHTKNLTFSEEPLKQIRQFFSKLIIIGFSSNQPDKDYKIFSSLKFKDPKCFQSDLLMGTFFQCWNKLRKISLSQVKNVYRTMVNQITSARFRFRIYLKQGSLKTGCRQMILDLIQKHKLQCENYSEISKGQSNVITVKLKSFSDRSKKQSSRKILNFIGQLITDQISIVEQQQLIYTGQKLTLKSKSDSDSVISQQQSEYQQSQPSITNKYRLQQLQNQQEKPLLEVILPLQQLSMQKQASRSPKIQQYLYIHHYLKCKVKNLLTHPHIIFQKLSSQSNIKLYSFLANQSLFLKNRADINVGSIFYLVTKQQAIRVYSVEVMKSL